MRHDDLDLNYLTLSKLFVMELLGTIDLVFDKRLKHKKTLNNIALTLV